MLEKVKHERPAGQVLPSQASSVTSEPTSVGLEHRTKLKMSALPHSDEQKSLLFHLDGVFISVLLLLILI